MLSRNCEGHPDEIKHFMNKTHSNGEKPVPLWTNDVPAFDAAWGQPVPSLTPYPLVASRPYGAVIICPGGGYGGRADHEGEPVARWLNSQGISAFVLNYRVAPYRHPVPLQDAQRAIRLVRHNAGLWNVDPTHVGVLGFSAGGHLASTAGTHYDTGHASAKDPVERQSCRPDALVLCYPVITFTEHRHDGSMRNLLGDDPDPELRAHLSNETQVSADTPPVFLWHTSDDAAVPVENSLLFASSLKKHGIPFELHVYPSGRHGLGLGEEGTRVAGWPALCAAWLRELGF